MIGKGPAGGTRTPSNLVVLMDIVDRSLEGYGCIVRMWLGVWLAKLSNSKHIVDLRSSRLFVML